MSRATGTAEEEDFGSRLKRVMQLTGLSDPIYAEAVVTVHEYDIVLDVLLINQTNETLQVSFAMRSCSIVSCHTEGQPRMQI